MAGARGTGANILPCLPDLIATGSHKCNGRRIVGRCSRKGAGYRGRLSRGALKSSSNRALPGESLVAGRVRRVPLRKPAAIRKMGIPSPSDLDASCHAGAVSPQYRSASRHGDVSVYRHRGQHRFVGARAGTNAPGTRAARRDCAAGRRAASGPLGEDDRRRHSCRLRRSSGCAPRDRRVPALAGRGRKRVRLRAQGPLRPARRHRRAPRQRLLRPGGQPRGAHHERRARRSGASVRGGRRLVARSAAAGACAA